MFEEIDNAVKVLADTQAGWVNRRDAAELLGRAAKRALEALSAHRQEPDVDVRGEVVKVLASLRPLAGEEPAPALAAPAPPALEELARACERPGHRTVEPFENGFVVEVAMKGDRRQRVYIMPEEEERGTALVRVFTYCGKPGDDALAWALRANLKFVHGALALSGEGDNEQFVLVNCYPLREATPLGIKATVKELAAYGDWLERKLTGEDNR